MAVLKLSDTEGNIHVIKNFPASLEELPYSQKIDFDVACEDIALWAGASVKDEEELDEDWLKFSREDIHDDAYYCFLMARAVSKFMDFDMNKIMKFDVSDLIDSHGNLLPFVDGEIEKPATPIDLENAEITLQKIYQVAMAVIGRYKFEFRGDDNYIFKHAGKWWGIPRAVRELFDKRKVFSSFQVQQAVETMMVKVYLHEQVNNKPREKVSAEQVANLRFSSHLKIIAACLTEVEIEGEGPNRIIHEKPLPTDQHEFDIAVTERMPLFQDIDTKTAMDIVFFLTGTTMSWLVTPKINTTLMPPQATVPTTTKS